MGQPRGPLKGTHSLENKGLQIGSAMGPKGGSFRGSLRGVHVDSPWRGFQEGSSGVSPKWISPLDYVGGVPKFLQREFQQNGSVKGSPKGNTTEGPQVVSPSWVQTSGFPNWDPPRKVPPSGFPTWDPTGESEGCGSHGVPPRVVRNRGSTKWGPPSVFTKGYHKGNDSKREVCQADTTWWSPTGHSQQGGFSMEVTHRGPPTWVQQGVPLSGHPE